MKVNIVCENPHDAEVELINLINSFHSVELRSVASIDLVCYDSTSRLAEFRVVHLYKYLEPNVQELIHAHFNTC